MTAPTKPEQQPCVDHCGHDPMTYRFDGCCSHYVQREGKWDVCGHRCPSERITQPVGEKHDMAELEAAIVKELDGVPAAPTYVVNCQSCGAVVELFPGAPVSVGSDDDWAMQAAHRIVDYIALPDSAEPDDSTGSPTGYIAAIIRTTVPPALPAQGVWERAIKEIEKYKDTFAFVRGVEGEIIKIACEQIIERLRTATASQADEEES